MKDGRRALVTTALDARRIAFGLRVVGMGGYMDERCDGVGEVQYFVRIYKSLAND